MIDLAQYRKTLVAAATFVVNLLTVLLAVGNILPDTVLPYVAVVLTLAGTYGVYATPNRVSLDGPAHRATQD